MFWNQKHAKIDLEDFRSNCTYCEDGVGFPISDNVIRCTTCKAAWGHFNPEFDNDGWLDSWREVNCKV